MNPDELAFRLTDVFYVAFGANQGTTASLGIDYTYLFPVPSRYTGNLSKLNRKLIFEHWACESPR